MSQKAGTYYLQEEKKLFRKCNYYILLGSAVNNIYILIIQQALINYFRTEKDISAIIRRKQAMSKLKNQQRAVKEFIQKFTQ